MSSDVIKCMTPLSYGMKINMNKEIPDTKMPVAYTNIQPIK